MPKRRKRPPVILGQMQKLSTSNGRLFSVSVEGPHLTLADTMVAAPRYLYILEAHFDGAADLCIVCVPGKTAVGESLAIWLMTKTS